MMWFLMLRRLAPALAVAFVTAGLALGLHNWRVDRLQEQHRQALESTKSAMQLACTAAQNLTQGVSNAYQKKLADLNDQLAAVKRVRHNPRCVPTTASATSRRDAAAIQQKPVGTNAIRAEWLVDFAAEAEKYRLQLIACQDFVTRATAPPPPTD